ncbi:hypothetical protein FUAX_47230 (plasmid) [Fulvitalea axinellae]|uniref:ABC transmembrane type-1 domain-containing protein n=1 Tax=Fulvitalea axinellae TaxID=1182444 RepID=A0AAU9CJK3_9BACT|nr:hypothetical protein FUAX_47230 [Fulvitalea axinellae]
MTLTQIFARFRWRISVTLFIVLVEAVLFVLFPLFIGYAINGVLEKSYSGLIYLGCLSLLTLITGTARRFYDSRVYAGIYQELGVETFERNQTAETSKLSARINMLQELVEFFENSFPQLVNRVIGFVGILILLFSFSLNIFLACLVVTVVTVLVFGFTAEKTMRFNTKYNDTLEKQVSVLEQGRSLLVKGYVKNLMRWNIRLSDLETVNYSIVFLAMVGLMIYAVVESVGMGTMNYGAIFSVVMYVFEFMNNTFELPVYYQEWLRLKDISERLQDNQERIDR